GPHEFGTAIEPDGDGSHWFAIPPDVVSELASTVTVTIRPSRDWPEPSVPADIDAVLNADPAAQAIWNDITPAARWDWVRWAGTARQPETRARRVSSIPSRLRAGKRRPCCFDRNQCSLTVA
ncbi:MAG: YdeI/OmpD-associated family protein, partial [Fimbriimonadaceae bacterium]|nr:YdeI/OmpD-associated family protein [Fimbriimonadaceae bacterium]